MQHYDTLLLGSGFSSVGYAAARGRCLIVEEEMTCDTHLYLPLRSFCHHPYTPVTEEGRYLDGILGELGFARGEEQNTNLLEIALCRYLVERPQELLLKCRAVRCEAAADGGYTVTLSSNEGLTTVTADRVIDTRSREEDGRLTVLYLAKHPGEDAAILEGVFGKGTVEHAFYPERYALHAPVSSRDFSDAAAEVTDRIRASGAAVEILFIAPAIAYPAHGAALCDDAYSHPVEAFEVGYLMGKEGAR